VIAKFLLIVLCS